jgi:hypothetical protein
VRLELFFRGALLLALAGCPAPVLPDGGTPGDAGPALLDDGGFAYARSSKGQLRFKGPERLTFDYAAALELTPAQVCNELGQYSCTVFVHPLALGGVDPYGAGLYEAQPFTGVTTPIVVERVALAACAQRVTLDAANPGGASIFKNVALTGAKLAAPNGPEVRAAIVSLYERALLRDPDDDEVAALVKLSADIEGSSSPAPALDWMKAACFVTLSSAEAVFY